MRLRSLLAKDLRELLASRAFWLLLLMVGPLTGHAFITAVDAYAEASGRGGGPAALAQGLSPLDGILVPTFGAYDIAVTLLFPFVAIRLISSEKESGAWKLMLQAPVGIPTILLSKALTILIGWLLAWIPGLLALILWKLYGGTLYAPETVNLLLGHLLRVILASGVAIAAAAIATNASSAAIATLGFTVGTWALEFIGMSQGGEMQKIASYTPNAALRAFEQGQFLVSTAVVSVLIGVAGFSLAALWLTPRTVKAKLTASALLLGTFGFTVWGSSLLRANGDLSENRRNSFPSTAESALRQIRQPLRVTVVLAPEDPRFADFDRNILGKLQRLLPRVDVTNASQSHSGLFESPGDHYGEIWYELDGRKVMSRSTTEPIVLQTLYGLAQVAPVAGKEDPVYPGHPLAAYPRGAAWIYYAIWPLVVGLAAWIQFRNRS